MYRIFENTAVIRPFSISKLPFLVCFQLRYIFYMHVDKWMFLYVCVVLTKVFSGSCWDSEEDSMVVLIQSHTCQCSSDECISVRRKTHSVNTRGHCNNAVRFLSPRNLFVPHVSCAQDSIPCGSKLICKRLYFCLEIEQNFSKRPLNFMWDSYSARLDLFETSSLVIYHISDQTDCAGLFHRAAWQRISLIFWAAENCSPIPTALLRPGEKKSIVAPGL